jgi:hypothetical protein
MVYISGPITGYKDYNCDAFRDAAKKLITKGYNVFNPCILENIRENKDYTDYMKEALQGMLLCDTIYLLKGWKQSKGAVMEYKLAEFLDFVILEEDSDNC